MYWNFENADRIKRYFQGTFVQLKNITLEYLFVESVNSDRVMLTDIQGNYYEINLNNGYHMKYMMPTNRITFQHGPSAYVLTRIPARQYKRGICVDNTFLYKVSADGKTSNVTISQELLNSLGDKKPYNSLTQACLNFLNKISTSEALTHRLSTTARGRLLLDGVVIGVVSYKKKFIRVLPQYKSIIEDYLAQTNDIFTVQTKEETNADDTSTI